MSTSLEVSREQILGTDDAGELAYEDPVEVAKAIVSRILEAETPEQVLEQAGLEHARDVLGETLILEDARFQRSRFTEGEGPTLYAILQAVDPNGVQRQISCGGRNVLAQVYKLMELDALPVTVQLVEGSETAQGYKPLWLEQVAA